MNLKSCFGRVKTNLCVCGDTQTAASGSLMQMIYFTVQHATRSTANHSHYLSSNLF